MKLMRRILALTLCLCCMLSFSGCSLLGLSAMGSGEDPLIKYDEEDAESVKNLMGDIADIAADTYREHFGEIDIGDMADNVDRDKVADFMDNAAVFLKDGWALLTEIWAEAEAQNAEQTNTDK